MRKLLFCLPLILFAACAAPDLSTDLGVLAAYQRERDMEFITLDDLCIQRPPTFPDVIVVGLQAPPIGCAGSDLFVGDAFGDIYALTPTALTHAGWVANASQLKLAAAWTEEAVFAWDTILQEATPDFAAAGKTFTPPSVERVPGGVIEVIVWVQEGRGEALQNTYYQASEVFHPSGQIGLIEILDKFAVEDVR
jgi:hypothetical protein